jgi:hypothetical protein
VSVTRHENKQALCDAKASERHAPRKHMNALRHERQVSAHHSGNNSDYLAPQNHVNAMCHENM